MSEHRPQATAAAAGRAEGEEHPHPRRPGRQRQARQDRHRAGRAPHQARAVRQDRRAARASTTRTTRTASTRWATWSRSPKAGRSRKTKSWVVTRLVKKAAGRSERLHSPSPRRPHRCETGVRPFLIAPHQEMHMLKVGDKLPAGKPAGIHRSRRQRLLDRSEHLRRRRSRPPARRSPIFALPGAFTPTCSAKHVPGYVEKADDAEGRRRRRDLVRVGQRRLRDGRLGPRPEDRRQGAHDGRRQRRLHQGRRA